MTGVVCSFFFEAGAACTAAVTWSKRRAHVFSLNVGMWLLSQFCPQCLLCRRQKFTCTMNTSWAELHQFFSFVVKPYAFRILTNSLPALLRLRSTFLIVYFWELRYSDILKSLACARALLLPWKAFFLYWKVAELNIISKMPKIMLLKFSTNLTAPKSLMHTIPFPSFPLNFFYQKRLTLTSCLTFDLLRDKSEVVVSSDSE